MPLKKSIIISLLLIPFIASALDKNYIFNTTTKDDGLSSNSISGIQQDSQGFLWLGTQGGLNFYDGYDFKIFTNDPFNENSLGSDSVQTLYIDENDILWAGTYNGISRLDIKTMTFTNYKHDSDDPNSLSNPVVTEIDTDLDGNIWAATLGGLNRLDPDTGLIQQYTHNSEIPGSLMNDVVRSVLVDSKGRIWVGNLSGIDLYNPINDDFIHYNFEEPASNGLQSPLVMKIIEHKENELFVGTWDGGVSKFNTETGIFTNYDIGDKRVYTLSFDKDGILWAGTWGGGVYLIDTETTKTKLLLSKDGSGSDLSSNTIYSFLEDSSGIMWVGTNGGGLNKRNYQSNNYTFLSYDPDDLDGLTSGKVEDLYQDNQGDIWISVYNGGLNRYDPITKTLKHYKHDENNINSISDDIVSDLFEDSRGRFWLTTNSGIDLYDKKTDSFTKFNHSFIKENKINNAYTRVFEDNEQNLWIGTYFDGLLKTDIELNKMKQYTNISDKLIRTVIQRKNGQIWVTTNRGLNLYNPVTDGFKQYLLDKNNPKGINNNNIRAVLEDKNGILWIGTSGGGVMRYNDSEDIFDHFTTKDGLTSNYVVSMTLDEENNIWIGTKYGVSILNTETLDIENISKVDGLQQVEFSEGSLKDSNGKIYLGAYNVVSVFDNSNTVENKVAPPIYITSVDLGNTTINVLNKNIKELSIEYKDAQYMTFNYVGLNYLHPLKTEYSFKLEGFDNDWSSNTTRRFAIYTNLSPGKYTLKVKAVNSSGVWSDEIAELHVNIKPPLSRTWYAYVAYIIILISFIYLVISFKESVDRKKRLLELEVINNTNKNLSMTDPLTQIYNRRYLKQHFDSEIESAIIYQTPITTIMIDIDDFKKYNDTYGHLAGDKCLIIVVEAIKSVINRPGDSFVRYGGEEFCIILPRTNLDGARIISENIRKAVEDTKVVTVSVGIHTSIPTTSDSLNNLIKSADEALYKAKLNGKNRVEET